MRISLIIFLVTAFGRINAQETVNDSSQSFLVLKALSKSHNLVIAYRTYSYWNQTSEWNILAVDSMKTIAKYASDANFNEFSKIKAEQDSLKKDLQLFYKYDLFSMKTIGDWSTTCDSCDIGIYDGAEYAFIILQKGSFTDLYFYEPGYYVTCCKSLKGYGRIVDLIRELFSNK